MLSLRPLSEVCIPRWKISIRGANLFPSTATTLLKEQEPLGANLLSASCVAEVGSMDTHLPAQNARITAKLEVKNTELELGMGKICGCCERGQKAILGDPSSSAAGLRPAKALASFICRLGSGGSIKAKACVPPAARPLHPATLLFGQGSCAWQ